MGGKKNFFKPIVVTSSLTAFTVSATTNIDACTFLDGSDYSPYSVTLYHDGVGATPQTGDTVYQDAAGTIVASSNGYYVEATLTKLAIGGSGVVFDPGCR